MSPQLNSFASERLGTSPTCEFGIADTTANKLAVQLAGELEDERTTMMCVYGSWGSGKSHFLNWLGHYLTQQNQLVCCFNAWEHEAEGDLASAYLRAIASESSYSFAHDQEGYKASFLPNKDTIKKLAWNSTKLIAGIALSQLPPIIGTALGQILTVLEEAKKNEDIIPQKTKLEELHEDINTIVAKITDKEYTRLFVLVDDLDRCSPDSTIRFIEWMKNHFAHSKCTFVVGLDISAAANLINCHYHQYLGSNISDNSYGYLYLTKLFEMIQKVPDVYNVEKLALNANNLKDDSISDWLIRNSIVACNLTNFTMIYTHENAPPSRILIRATARARIALPLVLSFIQKMIHNTPNLTNDESQLKARVVWWMLLLCVLYEYCSPDFVQDLCTGSAGQVLGSNREARIKMGFREIHDNEARKYFEHMLTYVKSPNGPKVFENNIYRELYRVISELH